jgi:hypothetical protein
MKRESRANLQRLHAQHQAKLINQRKEVTSLLDEMIDGKEFQSIVDLQPTNMNVMDEVVKGLYEIENIRKRPCLLYVGNVITKDGGDTGVESSDDLPFKEMVNQVPKNQKSVDIYLATNGGSGEQISRFVNCLRSRFDDVNFLIPSFCMSAGTLFALSGEKIYMTDNAYLGPIDPQVPSTGGRFVPAQALLLLVDQLQKKGQDAMDKGQNVPWSAVRLIDSLDKKELGAAITATEWSKMLAAQYIEKYKFKDWHTRETTKIAVSPDYKLQRAQEIASALASHERWKNHGHSISREVLWNEIKLKIDLPDENLERSIRRLWALLTWLFDKSPIKKVICSSNYRYLKHSNIQE